LFRLAESTWFRRAGPLRAYVAMGVKFDGG
jgi:hypothetical protein